MKPKLGICPWCIPCINAREGIEFAAKVGLAGVEINYKQLARFMQQPAYDIVREDMKIVMASYAVSGATNA